MTALVRDPWRRSMAVAVGLVVAGIGSLLIAWLGIDSAHDVPEQLGFGMSGGVGGVALVGAGLALIDVQRRRWESAVERDAFDAFASELGEIADRIAARRQV